MLEERGWNLSVKGRERKLRIKMCKGRKGGQELRCGRMEERKLQGMEGKRNKPRRCGKEEERAKKMR